MKEEETFNCKDYKISNINKYLSYIKDRDEYIKQKIIKIAKQLPSIDDLNNDLSSKDNSNIPSLDELNAELKKKETTTPNQSVTTTTSSASRPSPPLRRWQGRAPRSVRRGPSSYCEPRRHIRRRS